LTEFDKELLNKLINDEKKDDKERQINEVNIGKKEGSNNLRINDGKKTTSKDFENCFRLVVEKLRK
jgi:hypothetical protein